LSLLGELAVYAKEVFGLGTWSKHNGLVPLPGLRHRAHRERVIIHPTAGSADGCWPRDKYAEVAKALIARGFAPEFVVEPKERAAWLGESNRFAFKFVEAASLDALAAYIHESAWFIGSDSGVGHLASACGVPTVTICERMRNMRRWKPGWSDAVVAQPVWLPLRSMRLRYWKEATTVNRVLQAFGQLTRLQSSHAAHAGALARQPAGNGR
jgi:ADP-heptose:LPS heptosyltransferase